MENQESWSLREQEECPLACAMVFIDIYSSDREQTIAQNFTYQSE